MSLARRSVTSSAYNVTANIIQVAVLLGRSIALARLLTPDLFGIYVFASSIISLTRPLAMFGLQGAFLYRTPTGQEEQARRVHFTLIALFGAVWAMMLAVMALFFAPEVRTALWVMVGASYVLLLTQTPRASLTRNVWFRRLALLQVVTAVATTIVAVGMAWRGFGLWSLLATDIVAAGLALLLFYGPRPVWRPRLGWSPVIVRDFLQFGGRVLGGSLLAQALDRVDDLWTGVFLGDTALGFYSRAYRFANYPRILLAKPLNQVVAGTYAQLTEDRLRLSRAFFRVNALMVRVNFALAGLLALVAPEFIVIALGARWLPMLDAFRLMLVYTLLDPIKITVASVLTASGAPEKVIHARAIQLGVLLLGLATMGPVWGITGVAIAVDLMLVVGMGILFWQARRFVDFDLKRLFAIPVLALVVGMVAAWGVIALAEVPTSPWWTGTIKATIFLSLYVAVLFLLEREQIPRWTDILKLYLPG